MSADEYAARLDGRYQAWLEEGERLRAMGRELRALREREAVEDRKAIAAARRVGIVVEAA